MLNFQIFILKYNNSSFPTFHLTPPLFRPLNPPLFRPQAKRAGVDCIILPFENKKDYSDLEGFITDGINVHFAQNYSEVYNIIFEEE